MTREKISYPFTDKPDSGDAIEIASGLHWLRMPLPMALNHINLWLLADGDGWALVDTGLGDDHSKQLWQKIFAQTMCGRPLTRVVVTHMHPDHVGCAGFLTGQFDVGLWMTREEYLLCRVLVADTGRQAPEAGVAFYKAAGYDEQALALYRKRFGFFGRYVTPLPDAYQRLEDGKSEQINGESWEVVVGRGHSPEHACLFNEKRNVILGGDQLLPAISANVSVYPTEPDANPLREWIETLTAIRQRIPGDVLVLPSHGKPYYGAHARIDSLVGQHFQRFDAILEALDEPRRALDLFPALYRREIGDDNRMFATGEAIAHLNYLLHEDQVGVSCDEDGVNWYHRR